MDTPINLFISFSGKDESYMKELLESLDIYIRKNTIKVFTDRDILPGQVWDQVIKERIRQADVIVFLVSPSLLASDYINEVEIPLAVAQHQQGKAQLVPILIRTSLFEESDLHRYKWLPQNKKPVNNWDDRSEAWTEIVQDLSAIFKSMKPQLTKGRPVDDAALESDNSIIEGINYLLVIGINQYSGKIPMLNNAVRDAQRFKELLQSKYAFFPQHTWELYDDKATRVSIIDHFDEIEKRITEKDNFIFYFSGHGEYIEDRKSGFWLPVDAQWNKRATYLNNSDVLNAISTSKARHVLGIVDACFSGSLLETRDASIPKAVQRYYNIPSRFILTAGRKEPVLDGFPGGNSPFAKSLLTQLDANSGKTLSVNRLWEDMQEGIVSNSTQTPQCEPLRNAGHQGGQFYFIRKDISTNDLAGIIKPAEASDNTADQAQRAATSSSEEKPKATKPEFPVESLSRLREVLKAPLKVSDFSSTFDLLNQVISSSSRRENDVIMQQSQFHGVNNQIQNGIIDPGFAQVTLNRIRYGLNSIIDDLEEGDLKEGVLG
ncbi:MAG TPA: caspase family protein [Saprospiraceae bacterium]|nr:caspase family protein [Saprospiraceae bacterium]HMQ84227.1 caspase family protein [Saprospiraceae bacterium]